MNKVIQRLSIVAVTTFALPILALAPAAYARQGGDDQSQQGSTSTGSTQTTQPATDQKRVNEAEVRNQVTTFEQKGSDSVKSLEAKQDPSKKHTEQERQKSCEARATEITKKLNKKVTDAEKHKAVFDKIFTRVKEFHDTKNLTTPNYDTLVAKTVTAQTAAETSIATLKTFDTTVDCTQVDAAVTKLAGFREALKATRDSLKTYRTSIKDLLVAVKGSIPAETTTNSGTTTTGN